MRVSHIGGRIPRTLDIGNLSVFDAINEILGDDFFSNNDADRTLFDAPRQVRALQTGGFPPTDISIDDQKSYIIEVALAGVPRDKIKIEFQGRQVSLLVDVAERDEHGEAKVDDHQRRAYLQRGIKKFTMIENQWIVPSKFDIEKAKADFKDGLLTITIPLNEKEERLLEKREIKLLESGN